MKSNRLDMIALVPSEYSRGEVEVRLATVSGIGAFDYISC